MIITISVFDKSKYFIMSLHAKSTALEVVQHFAGSSDVKNYLNGKVAVVTGKSMVTINYHNCSLCKTNVLIPWFVSLPVWITTMLQLHSVDYF